MSTTKSLGEQRVRIDFNVSGNSKIDEIKRAGADFINLINSLQLPENIESHSSEWYRLKALALTSAEEATQWSVKAITIQ